MASRVVYYRRNHENEWVLRGIVKTRKGKQEHTEASTLLTEIAKTEKVGTVAYLEVESPLASTWSLRNLVIKASFVNVACKSFLKDSWKLIRSSGSSHYVPTDPRQMSLFESKEK